MTIKLLETATLLLFVMFHKFAHGETHVHDEESNKLQLVAQDPAFGWLESPIYNPKEDYLLFSDVKWMDTSNITCGMIWKYDLATEQLSEFLQCSGLVGPGTVPDNVDDYIEAGSNGLAFDNDYQDLIICQHGMSRIVQIHLEDVQNQTIAPNMVDILVDTYNGTRLNSPNDLVVLRNGSIVFTDPPFGLQYYSSDDPIANAFAIMPQEAAIYRLDRDVGGEIAANNTLTRLYSYGRQSNPWYGPNGIAVNEDAGDLLIVSVTDFENPRMQVLDHDVVLYETIPNKRIEGPNSLTLPALTDGVTYHSDHVFLAGPGGVYVYSSSNYTTLTEFIRINDLNANNEIGGGYLWITANQRLLRVPLEELAAFNAGGPTSGGSSIWTIGRDSTSCVVVLLSVLCSSFIWLL